MAKRAATSGNPAPEPSFEERLEALETVVRDLEGDELALDAAIERYREGVAHLRACRGLLDAAEQRLVELVESAEDAGGATERPLKVGEAGLETDEG